MKWLSVLSIYSVLSVRLLCGKLDIIIICRQKRIIKSHTNFILHLCVRTNSRDSLMCCRDASDNNILWLTWNGMTYIINILIIYTAVSDPFQRFKGFHNGEIVNWNWNLANVNNIIIILSELSSFIQHCSVVLLFLPAQSCCKYSHDALLIG